jgi:hypothetical protein
MVPEESARFSFLRFLPSILSPNLTKSQQLFIPIFKPPSWVTYVLFTNGRRYLHITDTFKGAKAASKRDRKDKDTKVAKSQLKVVRNPLRLHFRTGYTLIYGHY